jgi:hypothetical protein
MRPLRGVRYSCAGSTCLVQMARAPLGCSPDYVVDERVDNMFGPLVPVRDIQGVEVYTGASDVPGEFAGTNAGCGVIVIWTTNGRAERSARVLRIPALSSGVGAPSTRWLVT